MQPNPLSQLAASVSQAESLEALTRQLLELLEGVTGLESTYLTSIDEQRGLQQVLFSRNTRQLQILEGLSVPWGDTLCKRALDESRPFTDNVGECWADSDTARALGIRSYLSQPVRNLDGSVFGTLCAASAERRHLPPETVKVLGLFAQLIAYQVERERVVADLRKTNEELSSHVLTDPLTGVANRRGLMQELQRAVDRARQERGSVQVAFIDLDGFKSINDEHGHEAGDQFLMQIARRLAVSVRSCDFVGRYGGDEFVVIARNANLEELRQRLERLTAGRYQSRDFTIDYRGASVGVATSSAEDMSIETLVARADADMYHCKQARRQMRLN